MQFEGGWLQLKWEHMSNTCPEETALAFGWPAGPHLSVAWSTLTSPGAHVAVVPSEKLFFGDQAQEVVFQNELVCKVECRLYPNSYTWGAL